MLKEAINIVLQKNGMDVVLKLKVAPEIEDYFKRVASGESSRFEDVTHTEQSSKWLDESGTGLKFYIKSEKMGNKVPGIDVIDNFGNGLIDSGRINVALLRTVGASNEITIQTNDLLSYEEMKSYIEDLANWTRAFYENVLRPAEIRVSVGFDV